MLVTALLALGACVAGGPAGEDSGNNDANNAGNNDVNNVGNNDVNNAGNNDVNNVGNNDSPNNDNVDPLLPPQCEPTGEEICDGLDNDCDEQVDEDRACSCTGDPTCYGGPPQTRGVGACVDGMRPCDGEFFGTCTGWTGPVEEVCDDRIDNDCDGIVDEGACREVCQPGDSRECYGGNEALAGVGICNLGQQVCNVERRWDACEGWGEPQDEICDDGLDNDCDGVVDFDCNDDRPLQEDNFVVSEQNERQPVDFIMAVDNSGSMRDTVAQVEDNLGSFGSRLASSGIDYRFVMVSQRGTDRSEPDVCIQPPMAGPGCSNSARFRHLSQTVGSHSAYNDILNCYDGCGSNNRAYNDFLRPNSLKQIIVVTDDESQLPWPNFRDQLTGFIGEFILNGVVGTRQGGCVADVGNRYIEGATETGGELLHICDNDWGQVIDVLFESTISRLDSTFVLTRQPIAESIQVFVKIGNGPLEEQIGNWIYNDVSNAITFTDTTTLSGGVTVIVRYRL